MDSHYPTTDSFSFSESDDEVLHISFGPNRVSLSKAAAQDLSYRLASFLTFLDHKSHEQLTYEPAPCSSCEAECESRVTEVAQNLESTENSSLAANVLPFRTKASKT